MSSVRRSVCLSVTLIDCDDRGWNSSKIISRLINLGCWLSADPNMTGLLQWNTTKFSPEWGWGAEKIDFWRTKVLISLKRGKIGPPTKVTFVTNEDEYEVLNVIWIVPTSTTLDDFEGLLCSPFAQSPQFTFTYLL